MCHDYCTKTPNSTPVEVSQKYRFKQKPTENSVPKLLLNQTKYFKILVTLAIWNKILKSVTGRQKNNNTLTSEILQAVEFTFTVTVRRFMLLIRLYVCSTGPALSVFLPAAGRMR